jgi:hypothetical protein
MILLLTTLILAFKSLGELIITLNFGRKGDFKTMVDRNYFFNLLGLFNIVILIFCIVKFYSFLNINLIAYTIISIICSWVLYNISTTIFETRIEKKYNMSFERLDKYPELTIRRKEYQEIINQVKFESLAPIIFFIVYMFIYVW